MTILQASFELMLTLPIYRLCYDINTVRVNSNAFHPLCNFILKVMKLIDFIFLCMVKFNQNRALQSISYYKRKNS